MENFAFYPGLALLFTHELDAMPNHEWQALPLIRSLEESVAKAIFVIAHVPILVVAIACIASLNLKARSVARDIASGLLVAPTMLHLAFSGHSANQFSSLLSSILNLRGGSAWPRVLPGALAGPDYAFARGIMNASDS